MPIILEKIPKNGRLRVCCTTLTMRNIPINIPRSSSNTCRNLGKDKIAHAISAHYTHWGVPYKTLLDKALLACDELTGFIMACCWVRPQKIVGLKPKSVKKKLKSSGFAAKVERPEIYKGVELLGVDLNNHIQFIIDVLTQ